MNYLQNGISVQYRDKGEVRSDIVYLADYNLSLIHLSPWWEKKRIPTLPP